MRVSSRPSPLKTVLLAMPSVLQTYSPAGKNAFRLDRVFCTNGVFLP